MIRKLHANIHRKQANSVKNLKREQGIIIKISWTCFLHENIKEVRLYQLLVDYLPKADIIKGMKKV